MTGKRAELLNSSIDLISSCERLNHSSALLRPLLVPPNRHRDSFDYARSLVQQLRARQREIPLPIVLVANKSDLERNREVKSEGELVSAISAARPFMRHLSKASSDAYIQSRTLDDYRQTDAR